MTLLIKQIRISVLFLGLEYEIFLIIDIWEKKINIKD